MILPVPVENLIPHKKPMCFVDRLVEVKGQGGTAEALVSNGQVVVDDDGHLETLIMAEIIAQTYAAVKGFRDHLSGKPVKQGLLVGIKKVIIHKPVIAGDRLRIEVNTVGSIAGFAVVKGVVTREDEVVAQGKIKIWVKNDEPEENED